MLRSAALVVVAFLWPCCTQAIRSQNSELGATPDGKTDWVQERCPKEKTDTSTDRVRHHPLDVKWPEMQHPYVGRMRIPAQFNVDHGCFYNETQWSRVCPGWETWWSEADNKAVVTDVSLWAEGVSFSSASVHWGLVFELKRPLSDDDPNGEQVTQHALVHRLQNGVKDLLTSRCNHAEVNIYGVKKSATVGVELAKLKPLTRAVMLDLAKDAGGPMKLRESLGLPRLHFGEVLSAAHTIMTQMDEGFSLVANNCRDFVRLVAIRLALAQQQDPALVGIDETAAALYIPNLWRTGVRPKHVDPCIFRKGSCEDEINVLGPNRDADTGIYVRSDTVRDGHAVWTKRSFHIDRYIDRYILYSARQSKWYITDELDDDHGFEKSVVASADVSSPADVKWENHIVLQATCALSRNGLTDTCEPVCTALMNQDLLHCTNGQRDGKCSWKRGSGCTEAVGNRTSSP